MTAVVCFFANLLVVCWAGPACCWLCCLLGPVPALLMHLTLAGWSSALGWLLCMGAWGLTGGLVVHVLMGAAAMNKLV